MSHSQEKSAKQLLEDSGPEDVALASSPIHSPASNGSSTSDPSNSSSEEDETIARASTSSKRKRKRHVKEKATKRVKPTSSRKSHTRVTMAPLHFQKIPRCNCNCRDKLYKLSASVAKIKDFLKYNYCLICSKAGHTSQTCRRRMNHHRPTGLDLD